jgi:circadian clock protein KaiC
MTRVSTGCSGLDDILGGGLTPNRLYLLEGAPGSGKTTLALQFLLEGTRSGEPGLYITLSETAEELEAVADSHGWALDGIRVFELASMENALSPDSEMTLFHPWEIELGETVKTIIEEVKRTGCRRVVFDSLSEMRLLAQDALRYRRQILALKQFFVGRESTVLLLDDMTGSADADLQLHSISHGVITLGRLNLDYGVTRRRLEVQKMRGLSFREGWHDYVIRTGGLEVFPRLVAADHHEPFAGEPVSSGIAELDALLGGGPLRGTTTLMIGPAGAGKTTIALRYTIAAAARGERSVIYEFDERLGTMLTRSAKLGMNVKPHIADGMVKVVQIDPAMISPGEFAACVCRDVEAEGARLIVIDSLTGYLMAMQHEKQVMLQIHELLSYLNQRGVATFIIDPQPGVVGSMQTALNMSYLADAVLLLRFFEAGGRMRKAISAIKNRGGAHEDTIRELRIDPAAGGVLIGEPLTEFQGVLTGTPAYTGPIHPLLKTSGSESRNAK